MGKQWIFNLYTKHIFYSNIILPEFRQQQRCMKKCIFAKNLKKMGRKSKFDSAFKTKVALDTLKRKETQMELAKKYGIAQKQITEWKREFIEKSGTVLAD